MSECANQRGFSLMELLVALSILIIGVLAVATMLIKSSDNAIFSNRERGSDTQALELVEALKGEIAQIKFADLATDLRLQKLVQGSSTRYEYQDDATASTGTETTGRKLKYVQRLGKGQGYVYKWRVGEITDSTFKLLDRTLMVEVTVGWNDKKYVGKYPCTGDPDPVDPLDPITGCARRSRITNWMVEPKPE
jgi:prepilin-type N-terminal cleavage/methylation domain-containing protein